MAAFSWIYLFFTMLWLLFYCLMVVCFWSCGGCPRHLDQDTSPKTPRPRHLAQDTSRKTPRSRHLAQDTSHKTPRIVFLILLWFLLFYVFFYFMMGFLWCSCIFGFYGGDFLIFMFAFLWSYFGFCYGLVVAGCFFLVLWWLVSGLVVAFFLLHGIVFMILLCFFMF